MTAYNPAEAERLIAEAREDDARMTDAPWHGDSVAGVLFGDGNHEDGSIELAHMDGEAKEFDPVGIARTRNNLARLADQLEAARAEVERLKGDTSPRYKEACRMISRSTLALSNQGAATGWRGWSMDERQALQDAGTIGQREDIAVDPWRDPAERPARPCPTCGKPGHLPQDHAGWDPSKDMP